MGFGDCLAWGVKGREGVGEERGGGGDVGLLVI